MPSYLRSAALAALAASALSLAGCFGGGDSSASNACPKIVTPAETQTIAFFGPNGHKASDVVVGGRIRAVTATCEDEKVGLAVRTDISFEAQRANLTAKDATLPYFVALVGPNQQVLEEQGFKIDMHFLPGETFRRMPDEKITVHLPIRDKSAAGTYAVVVGFQLTPDQIAFNREVAHPR